MASVFALVKAELLDAEGMDANVEGDRGGNTRFGISQHEYPHLDIHSLTFDQACDILERDFWDHYRLSEINNQGVANKIFIAIINMDPLDAGRCVQKALNILGAHVVEDGVMGSLTFKYLNDELPLLFLITFSLELVRFYAGIVISNGSQSKFLLGWIRRALL